MPKNESLEKQKLVEKEYYCYWNLLLENDVCIHGPSDCVTKVLWLCWEMKQVRDQVHYFAQSLHPSFQRKPRLGGSCPSSLPWQHLNPYTHLWVPGLGHLAWSSKCYTPRVGDFTNVCICKRKRKQQQNDAGMNIMEKLSFCFDTAITGVWWLLEVLPRPQPRGLEQTNLLPKGTFFVWTPGWGKGRHMPI